MHIVLTLVVGLICLWALGVGVLCWMGWRRKALLAMAKRIAKWHAGFLLLLALLLVDMRPCVTTPLMSTAEKVDLRQSLDRERDGNLNRISFSGGEIAGSLRSAANLLRIEFHSEVVFPMQDHFQCRFALGHPLGYLNGELDGSARVEDGRLTTTWDRFWIGRIPLVGFVRTMSQRLFCYILDQDKVTSKAMGAVRSAEIRDHRVYLQVVRDKKMISEISVLLKSNEMVEDSALAVSIVEAWVDSLANPMSESPQGDRFVEGTRFMFAESQRRAPSRSAMRQNRAAILAAAIWMGHTKFLLVTGRTLDPKTYDRVVESSDRVQVHGRNDLVRHFWVSAAITALASSRTSNFIGISKEEMDSGEGGSGFSFADLLADRAGVLFAELALGSKAQATAMQKRIARDWVASDAIAPIDGFPEGIRQSDFLETYGGVDGPLYRQWSETIDRRNAASRLLQKGR
jgi:hypothetical protein